MNANLSPAICASLALALAACGARTDDPAGEPPRELVLGLVPATEAQQLIDNVDPLADFLAAEIGLPVKSFVPQDYTGLIEAMGSGRADIGMLPPFASMLGHERYGIETILISLRDGLATYKAQWMSRDPAICDTPIEDRDGFLFCHGAIEKVRGKRVAFTDPNSTSGYLFPALQLLDAGIDPERDVDTVFLGSHDASVIAVMNGDVDVGVSFDDARTWVLDQYPGVGQEVIVFNESAPIPNDGVTVRGDLPPELKEKIKRAFFKIIESEAHLPKEEQTLYKIYEIDGFVDFEPGLHEPVRRAFLKMRDKIAPGS
ncbi:MAG: phosphate/phosphite/phosphonate ABC transporter substrate-binding protein [Acidobacteria bacterium]|nr:MAG: phosphate/phosphite/phosphonate ABC transporter substrate-binding protein [Acidobacteriota bacterium]